MADKFNRRYLLRVQSDSPKGDIVEIELPFTVEFDIQRSSFSSARSATIRIYNLGKNTRAQLRHDRMDGGNPKTVVFQAGYGDSPLSTLLTGYVTQAWSVREGVNFVTTISAFEAGFAYQYANTNLTFKAGTPVKSVIKTLVDSLKPFGVTTGAIGNYPGILARGNSYNGSTMSILTELTGGGFFIDNGFAHCLGDGECVDNEIFHIDSSTGLLGTPVRELTFFSFEMIFEPQLLVGQRIQVESLTVDDENKGISDPVQVNGLSKINSLHHRGTISETVCGEAITSVGTLAGSFVPISKEIF